VKSQSEETGAQPPSVFAVSPFRYPGGKAFFADVLAAELEAVASDERNYLEPFAGGAGAAIKLLSQGAATRIFLNDADPRVYSAWATVVHDSDRFVQAVKDVEVSVDTWRKCKAAVEDPSNLNRFELGFATFFLNRTNRSGILRGSGPIGGYGQTGKWKMDARFYRESMIQRAKWIGSQADRIVLSNLDAMDFLQKTADGIDLSESLYFIDPPYVAAGSRLYMNRMSPGDHKDLASFLCAGKLENWIVTYDDCELIRELYASQSIDRLNVRYSLQNKRLEGEVLIRPRA
jgi:DNA adenine methylase